MATAQLPEFLGGAKSYDSTPLTATETALFNDGISVLSSVYNEYGTIAENLLTSEMRKLVTMAQITKNEFKNLAFGGLYLKVGFNMGYIRPASFLTQNATTPIETFLQAGATTAGWGSLFGTESSPFNVSLDNGATNTVSYTKGNVTYGITGLLSYGSPKISEIKMYIQSEKYPIFRLQPVRLNSQLPLYYMKFPKPMYLGLDVSFAIDANYEALGQINIQPFGLQFSKSEYLQYK